MPVVRSPSSTKKCCICHEILNERERFSQTQQIYIYIYTYMKVDKGVVKIKFCYPMFACEENGKAPCKILQSLPFKKGFLEKYFCSFENILLGYSRSLFRNESPGGQCQILCFECQCPKIMVLSKALKAKLSSIPKSRKSVDAQPRMENRQAFV